MLVKKRNISVGGRLRSSDKVLEAFIGQGLNLGHGTSHLKIYKKNFSWVFLSKRERFCPGSRSLILCLLYFGKRLDERLNKLRKKRNKYLK